MDSVVLIAVTVVLLSWFLIRRRQRQKLPPGPHPFPIVGNIFQLGRQVHQSLADMSKTYGPLMSLQLGNVCTVVISSPDVAKLVLRENDEAFSGRTIPAAAEVHGVDKFSVSFIPAGEKWRKMRKMMREQMFSTPRLEAGEGLRGEKMKKLMEYVDECSIDGRVVDVGEAALVTTLNLLWVTFFSVDLAEFGSDATKQLRECIEDMMNVFGAPNVADFFPFLKALDPQGIKKRSELIVGKLLAMFQGVTDKRLASRSMTKTTATATTRRDNDLLDALLDSLEGSNEYDLSMVELQQLFQELFLAATHGIQLTVEWAMAELLAKPEKMVNAKSELRNVIGENNEIIQSDVSRLPYLRAVIKETLRLHPVAPLLIPRRADREVEISGYTIPQNAQIFINVWAIGRDSSVWERPNVFEPERFLDSKIGFKGQNFELLPFGSGRRMCPGMPLADRMVHLMVASLIHNFDWKMEEGEEVDTTEDFGISLHKAVPLKAIPIRV